jgi:hypothetical protein
MFRPDEGRPAPSEGETVVAKRVFFDVPLRAQTSPDRCWLAALLMMEDWYYGVLPRSRRPRAVSVAEHMAINKLAPGTGLPPHGVPAFAREVGLHVVRREATAANVLELLQTYGPLWYPGMNSGFGGATRDGHVVVITGLDDNDLLINDPAPSHTGSEVVMDLDEFFRKLTPLGKPPMFLVLLKDSRPR